MQRAFSFLLLLLLNLSAAGAAEPTIAAGSKIYVVAADGFDTFLAAALARKKVDLVVVTDREKADYLLEATSHSEKAGWAQTIFLQQPGSNEDASVRLVKRDTSEVVFAYAVHKRNSAHGRQSTAESCAKYLKRAIRK